MKKWIFTFLLFLLVGCDDKQYPPLMVLSESQKEVNDSNQLYADQYYVYLTANSKKVDLGANNDKGINPKDKLVSKHDLSLIFDQMSESILATSYTTSSLPNDLDHVDFSSCILWGIDQDEYKKNYSIRYKPSILYDVVFNLVDQQLVNENHEVVKLNNDDKSLRFGSLSDTKDNQVCANQSFGFALVDHATYHKLSGKVKLRVAYPVSYQSLKLNKSDIGHTNNFLGNKIELIALEGNRIHIKLSKQDLDKNIILGFYNGDNYFAGNWSSVTLPYSTYDAMRRHPNFNYEQFVAYFSDQFDDWQTQAISTDEPHVMIISLFDTSQISSIVFNSADEMVERIYTIPVDINVDKLKND